MTTLQNLTSLGMKPEDAMKGEPFELEVLTIKDAKRSKWPEVTNAEDSHDVINAYAADLASTLQITDDLEEANDELKEQVTHLSHENGQLNEALQKGDVVDQRLVDFSNVMGDMEEQLHIVLEHKQELDKEVDSLRAEVETLRERDSKHNDELTSAYVERDNLRAELSQLESQVQELDALAESKENELIRMDEAYDELERNVNRVLKNLYNKAKDLGVQFEDE